MLSPEKKNEMVTILNHLTSDDVSEEDRDAIVDKISDLLGDFMETECLRKIDKLSNQLQEMATRVEIQQIEAQLKVIKDEMDAKDSVIHDLTAKNTELENRLLRAETIIDTLQFNQQNARFHSVNNEQYQRKNNLIVFGIKESDHKENVRESVADVMKKCVPTVTAGDIDVAHRLGHKKADGKPRPIIAKMFSHDTRFEVLKARKALKGVKDAGVPLSIGEDICKEYQELVAAITAKGFTCWYWNTRVWIQRSDGSSISVQVQDNWELKINDLSIQGRAPAGRGGRGGGGRGRGGWRGSAPM